MTDAPNIRFLRDRFGQSVAYAVHGSGPLVICPAWWVSHVQKDWEHPSFRAFFEAVGEGLTLVRYDRPGVGLSDREVQPRTLEHEVDLLDDIADTLGHDMYSLLAISCAGPVAIHHAVRHPAKVKKIVFCGAFSNGPTICSRDVQNAVRGVVRAHWGMGSRALADIFFPDADAQQLEQFAKQTRDSASAEAADALLELTYTMDAKDLAGSVAANCLVLHRNGDRAIPFENGRALVAQLPSAELQALEGRAHPPWFDGDTLAHAANAFLRGEPVSPDAATVKYQPSKKESAQVRFNAAGKSLNIDGKDVALTPIEFGIMTLLTDRAPNVVSRDDLLEKVWRQPYDGSNRIDVAMSALRRKLGPWSKSIETVTGHGYRFREWMQR